MGYYLLDHPNPSGPNYYTTRRRPLVGIVVHCTAGLEDKNGGEDDSAEATAEYAAATTRDVSWHSGSDTDTVIELLPPTYTAWQCRDWNSSTYGHELSKSDMTWWDEPADWVAKTLVTPAAHLRGIAEDAGIPIRKVDPVQLAEARAAGDPSLGGFIGHQELDPTSRFDPGDDFPWDTFLELIGDDMHEHTPMPDDLPREWADGTWEEWCEDSGTKPDTRGHTFYREDLGWVYARVINPLLARVASLEAANEDLMQRVQTLENQGAGGGISQAAADERYVRRGRPVRIS